VEERETTGVKFWIGLKEKRGECLAGGSSFATGWRLFFGLRKDDVLTFDYIFHV
jgi:hypothetical protein